MLWGGSSEPVPKLRRGLLGIGWVSWWSQAILSTISARGGAGFGIVGALALAASPSRLSMLARTSSAGFMDKQNWVVIGDVLNEAKPAARVVSTLREAGKTVHLVNPRDKTGTCKPTLSAVEDPVEVVDLIINSRDGIKQVEQMVSLGIKQIWIQPGAGSSSHQGGHQPPQRKRYREEPERHRADPRAGPPAPS